MPLRIKATPSNKAKPTGPKATASKVKSAKATARGKHPKQPRPDIPVPQATTQARNMGAEEWQSEDESQDEEDTEYPESRSSEEMDPKLCTHHASDRFK
jgi:hypothetical protein